MTDPTTPVNPLKPAQRRRVAALEASRDVQTTRRSAGVLTAPSTTPPDAVDLVTVARFILTGEDPWPAIQVADKGEPESTPDVDVDLS